MSKNDSGRNATKDWLIRRMDQFHFAFVIQVAIASKRPPMDTLVKYNQFVM
jgi:hypothetical protein